MNRQELAIIRSDYYSAIADYGFNHKTVIEQTKNETDRIFDEPYGLYTKESEIDGIGLFSGIDINDGELVAIARLGGKRTTSGRYTNHHPNPNGFLLFIDDNIWITAKRDIYHGEEITIDYRQALSLQIKKDTNLISNELSLFETKREFLSGPISAAYDLLINEDHLINLSLRDRILAFENVLNKYPQTEIKTEHEFIEGLYKRQITFPKGCLATGKIHPVDHMDVMLSGEMIVATENGYKYLKAPLTMTSRASKKKAGYALTEVTWISYHPTDKKTVEEVEMEIFTDEFLEIDMNGSKI